MDGLIEGQSWGTSQTNQRFRLPSVASSVAFFLPWTWICKQRGSPLAYQALWALKKTVLSKRKITKGTGSQDSCTICMTWALKGRNKGDQSRLKARMYTWCRSPLRSVGITQTPYHNGIILTPAYSWGTQLPPGMLRAGTMRWENGHYQISLTEASKPPWLLSESRKTDEGLESMSRGDTSILICVLSVRVSYS